MYFGLKMENDMKIYSNVKKLRLKYNGNIIQFENGEYNIPDGKHQNMLIFFQKIPEKKALLFCNEKQINKIIKDEQIITEGGANVSTNHKRKRTRIV